MKKLLIVLLLLHVVLEGGLGLTIVISPTLLIPDADMNTITSLITYGVAAVTMALVVAWFWPLRRDDAALALALGILATFHTALVVAAIVITLNGGDGKPLLIHVLLAACFWFLWARRQRIVW